MKTQFTQKIIFTFIIVLSIASCIFINTVDPPQQIPVNDVTKQTEQTAQDVNFPDVQLMKKIFRSSTKFLPTGS